MDRQESRTCQDFETFGECRWGSRCNNLHGERIYQNKFFWATLENIASNNTWKMKNIHGDKREEEYYVCNSDWHMRGAKTKDLVLFQASEKTRPVRGVPGRYVELRFGRVVVIVKENPGIKEKLPAKLSPTKVFTVDDAGTHCRDDGFSIEKCSEHDKCKKVGIHIVASALEDLSKVPCEKTTSYITDRKHRKGPCFTLEEGKTSLVLSVIVHTGNQKEISDPGFMIVAVENNYNFSHSEKYKKDLDVLWDSVRQKLPDWVLNQRLHKYKSYFALGWKERFVIEEMMNFYRDTVKKSVLSQWVITKAFKHPPIDLADDQLIAVSEDIYKRAETSSLSKDNPKILDLVTWGMRYAKFQAAVPGKSVFDAEKFENNDGKHSVIQCTSPMQTLPNFVNQQILIRCLLGCAELYSRAELLGMLCTRFRSPILYRTYVKGIDDKFISLQYMDVENLDYSLHHVAYGLLAGREDHFERETKELTYQMKSCTATNYCNKTTVHLKGREYKKFLDDANKDNLNETNFNEMNETKVQNLVGPYKKVGDGTVLNFHVGIELQLQISIPDARKRNNLGLRMLRIGKDCQACLTHNNNPELAFKTVREDICELIKKVLSQKEQQQSQSGSPESKEYKKTVLYLNVTIQWDDEYCSGGSFVAPGDGRAHLEEGDLLCIRKEVTEDSTGEIKYIWCCHAIVSDPGNGERRADPKFSVCTLSQSEKAPGNEKYCVDVIGITRLIPTLKDAEDMFKME